MGRKVTTEKEKAEIKKLYEDSKLSIEQIAKLHKRHVNTINYICKELKRKNRRKSRYLLFITTDGKSKGGMNDCVGDFQLLKQIDYYLKDIDCTNASWHIYDQSTHHTIYHRVGDNSQCE